MEKRWKRRKYLHVRGSWTLKSLPQRNIEENEIEVRVKWVKAHKIKNK